MYRQGVGTIGEIRGGTKSYYHPDELGSNRTITNASGTVSATRETDAFGNIWTPGTSGAMATPFGFAGQHGYQTDADSGLMRLGHRYYDANAGRFLSRDPIQDGDNWYTYCNNDPINNVDPMGLSAAANGAAWGTAIGAVAFGVVGFFVAGGIPGAIAGAGVGVAVGGAIGAAIGSVQDEKKQSAPGAGGGASGGGASGGGGAGGGGGAYPTFPPGFKPGDEIITWDRDVPGGHIRRTDWRQGPDARHRKQ